VRSVAVKIGLRGMGEGAGSSRFRQTNWMRPFVSHVKPSSAGGARRQQRPVHQPDDMVERCAAANATSSARRARACDPFLPAKIAAGRLEGHPRVHRLQSVRIPDAAAGVALLQRKTDLSEEYRRGCIRAVRPDRQTPACSCGNGPGRKWSAPWSSQARLHGPSAGLRARARRALGAMSALSALLRIRSRHQLPPGPSWRAAQCRVALGVGPMTADRSSNTERTGWWLPRGAHWSTVGARSEVPDRFTAPMLRAGSVLTPSNHARQGGARRGSWSSTARVFYRYRDGRTARRSRQAGYVVPHERRRRILPSTPEPPTTRECCTRSASGTSQITGRTASSRRLAPFYLYRDSAELYELEPVVGDAAAATRWVYLDCVPLVLVTSPVPTGELYAHSVATRRVAEKRRPGVYRIGDCTRPRQSFNAIIDGHRHGAGVRLAAPPVSAAFHSRASVWGHETFPKRGRCAAPGRGELRRLGRPACRTSAQGGGLFRLAFKGKVVLVTGSRPA